MKNKEYWAERMRLLEEALLDKSYEYVKNLDEQYELAIKSIEHAMRIWYQRFAKENFVSLTEARRLLTTQELEEFKWTVEEYIKYGQENTISQAWLQQLKNASARVHVSRLESLKLQLQQQVEALHGKQADALNSALAETYERGYYYTAFELQKGVGVGFSLHSLSEELIHKALAKPWAPDGKVFSDRIWANTQALTTRVNTQLTQMIMRGLAPDKAINAIAERFNVSKKQAGRLIMTESAAFANTARKDCFNDLDVEQFIIVETLDHLTCKLCAELDGKVYPMSAYTVGVTVPPFHPWCRGTTAPYFKDLEDVGNRFARNAEGQTYEVPKDMTYAEWLSKSVKTNENSKIPFTNTENDDIIKSRNLAMGLRRSEYHILTEEEINTVKAEAKALGIDISMLHFNEGDRTGFAEDLGVIHIRGDILPDLYSTTARDRMSIRAVLAHEYYGHYMNHPSEYDIGDWRDEFRASYDAAVNAPNLTDQDRMYLMMDAYDRAHEAGINLEYDEVARRLIYGV